jgi:hypothetical protein
MHESITEEPFSEERVANELSNVIVAYKIGDNNKAATAGSPNPGHGVPSSFLSGNRRFP